MKAVWSRMIPSMRDLSPENAALLLSVGLVLGIFPMYGLPTILCILASLVARVNFPALQVVNQLSWPLQIVMLVPLARLGSWIVKPSNGFATSIAGRLGAAALQAVTGWLCVCIPLGLLLYFALLCVLRRNRGGKVATLYFSPQAGTSSI